MKILDRLGIRPDLPLLTVGERTWTRGEFLARCEQAANLVSAQRAIDNRQFALLWSEHPAEFYACLLALMAAGCRVCLPTRETLSGAEPPFKFVAQTIRVSPDGLTVEATGGATPTSAERGNIVAFSSGSTGKAKGITHDWEHFLANAESVSSLMPGGRPVSVTYLKPYLVSAISHFLVHLMLEGHLIFQPFEAVSRITHLAGVHPGLGVVGSPFQVTSAFNLLPDHHQPRLFFTSGDVVSRHAIKSVLDRFPGATFYAVYGLAELAGRFFVNPVVRGGVDTPPDALGCAIPGTLPSLREGHMLVDSNFLFHGYLIDDDFVPAGRPHDSGDLVDMHQGQYYFVGRSNAEVKVLGNKVNLTHLETRIKNALGSDDLVVITIQDSRFGNLLGLVIKDAQATRQSLQEQLRKHLGPSEMPHKYFVLDRFPMTATMKVDRRAIAAHLGLLEQL